MDPQKPFLINAFRGRNRNEIYCRQFYDALRFMFIDDLIIIWVFCQKDPWLDPHDFYEVFFCNKKVGIRFFAFVTTLTINQRNFYICFYKISKYVDDERRRKFVKNITHIIASESHKMLLRWGGGMKVIWSWKSAGDRGAAPPIFE